MIAMELMSSETLRWVSRGRTVLAWLTLAGLLSVVIASYQLRAKFPGGPWPSHVPRPAALDLLVWWRNWSIIATVVLGLLSIPKWQSLVGLGGLILFLLVITGGY
jgi:hypothetical protein